MLDGASDKTGNQILRAGNWVMVLAGPGSKIGQNWHFHALNESGAEELRSNVNSINILKLIFWAGGH